MPSFATRLMTQPVTVQNRGPASVDEYGSEVLGPLGAPVATLGYLEVTQTREVVHDQETVVVERIAYLPAGTVVGPLDRITFDGNTWEVDGDPDKVWNPRLRIVSHIRARLATVKAGA